MPSSHAILIQRFFEALGGEGAAEALRAYTQDESLLASMTGLAQLRPGCVLGLQDVIAEGDRVLALFALLDAQRNPTPWGGAMFFRLEGETIVEYRLIPEMSELPDPSEDWPFRA